MQVTQAQLKRQQEILGVLGFYFGAFDGIWGPKSIEAKKKFEANPSFTPGIPNNGLPFGERPPYPASISFDHVTQMLHHPKLLEKAIAPFVEPEPESYEVPVVAEVPTTEAPQPYQQNQQKKK